MVADSVLTASVNASPTASESAFSIAPQQVQLQPKAKPATTALASNLPAIRLRTDTLDRLVNQAGEVNFASGKLESHVSTLKTAMTDLQDNVSRITAQLREVEIAAESQMSSRLEASKADTAQFDPLEFDRFTRFQELTRMLAESLGDMTELQSTIRNTVASADRDLASQGRLNRNLTQSLMRTRLVQFDALADRLYRVSRQSAIDTGKKLGLDIVGGSVEIDRSILERMTAPIEHLLRNAVVHGLETTAARRTAGKPEQGKITLRVRQLGNEIEITLSDDGAGLNLGKIRSRAEEMGLVNADSVLDANQISEFIFLQGFSTADVVSELAGRGVGMDVVRSEVLGSGGRIQVQTTVGQGSDFIIRLPLTLAVNQVVVVRAGTTRYAIPAALVQGLHTLKAADLAHAYDQAKIEIRGQTYPFAYLPDLLKLNLMAEQARVSTLMLIENGAERVAVQVDEIIGNQEVVVKNIGSLLALLPGISSATILADAGLCLILDPVALWQNFNRTSTTLVNTSIVKNMTRDETFSRKTEPVQLSKTVMVVDDSLTVRKITERLLLRAGYQVLLAKDGVDALEQLVEARPDVMLVDIEMPRMDGFDLTRNIRADEKFNATPIVIITSRMADKHREYAMSLGVDVYLGKPYRDDELLAWVANFMTQGRAAAAKAA